MATPFKGAVVCLGASLVDLTFRCDLEPVLHTSNPSQMHRSPGGVVRNIAHHLALLGTPVELLTVLGRDPDGYWLERQCRDAGIGMEHIAWAEETTGTFASVATPAGDLYIGAVTSVTDKLMTIDFMNERAQLIRSASVVIADCNLSVEALRWLMGFCAQHQVPLIVETVSIPKAKRPSAIAGRADCILGGVRIGAPSAGPGPEWPQQFIPAPLIGTATDSLQEIWRCATPCSSGRFADIAWRRAGPVLYGVLELAESDFPGSPACSPLQAASQEAYRRIFRLLEAQQSPNLWRVWNYLADINLETHGLERYRQFNIGRQDAFLEYSRGATGNVPAACAIGLTEGPLRIAFMAGSEAAVAIENPRQISAYDYPAEYGPRSPTFSRAALVPTDRWARPSSAATSPPIPPCPACRCWSSPWK